jgi:serine/threonine-protein kinase
VTSLPDRLVNALADRYRIERELGAGGMATVFLAEDLRHRRKVALKVLRPELAAVIGAERFLQEITTTAALQHPHILPLFDSGDADGFLFYVMPYIDGQTLRERLQRERQLSLEDALRITKEVADALQHAHEHGVIHRDIKPENILLANGRPMVADFGIALAVQQAGGERMTQTGLSLGTPQYMSPEQAMGERTLDARADVYALGAVLYEMLTGDPPFTGSSVQAIVARILSERPTPIETFRDTVPPHITAAVARALAKLPADRFASAAQFAQALSRDDGTSATYVPQQQAKPASSRVLLALAAVTVMSLGLAAWALTRPSADTLAVQSFDAALPDSAKMSPEVQHSTVGFGIAVRNFSIAPDGSFIVYVVQRNDSSSLWYRSLIDATLRRIPGTDGGMAPRVSPDGRRIVFISRGNLAVIPIEGGAARILREGVSRSAEWISPTRLYAFDNDGYRLTWIDPDAGSIEEISLESQGMRCIFGMWLPEQERLLCSFNETAKLINPRVPGDTVIRTTAANGELGPPVSGSDFRIIDGRYLLYVTLDGELRAASYDPKTLSIGRSVALASGVYRDVLGATQVDISANGILAFAPAAGRMFSQLVQQRGGEAPVPLPVEAEEFLRFDLTRDRRRLAAVVGTRDGQELRVYDLRSGQRSVWLRGQDIQFPAWSPRGDRLAVQMLGDAQRRLVIGSPGSSTPPETLSVASGAIATFDALEFIDEQTILVRDPDKVLVGRLDISTKPARLDTLVQGAIFASVSPDRRRMMWHSPRVGTLYVSSFPPSDTRSAIAENAVEPLWLSPTEVLHRSGVSWYRAQIDAATGELTGPPRRWGTNPLFFDTPGWSNRLSHDGGILYMSRVGPTEVSYLRLMPDFFTRMKSAVAEANR